MAIPQPRNGSAALITGASSGIGAGYARELARRGHNLVLVARRRERLESLAAELTERWGVRVEVLDCDISRPEAGADLTARTAKLGLAIDILVNNAGFGTHTSFVKSSLERELEQVRVNATAVVDLTGRFLPAMVERGRGAVLNVASIAGFQPLPYEAIYGATKAFVLSFTEALHAENSDTGVSILAVCPGPVPTEWQQVAGFEDQHKRLLYPTTTVEAVVDQSLTALAANKRAIIPGLVTRLVTLAMRPWPTSLKLPVAKKMLRPSE